MEFSLNTVNIFWLFSIRKCEDGLAMARCSVCLHQGIWEHMGPFKPNTGDFRVSL